MASIVSSVVDSKVVKQNLAKTDQFPNGDYGVTWLSRNSAGSGPFILRKWEKGEGVVLDANAGHFRYAPKMKRVIYKDIAEASSRRLQVEKGDLDIIQIFNGFKRPEHLDRIICIQFHFLLGAHAQACLFRLYVRLVQKGGNFLE